MTNVTRQWIEEHIPIKYACTAAQVLDGFPSPNDYIQVFQLAQKLQKDEERFDRMELESQVAGLKSALESKQKLDITVGNPWITSGWVIVTISFLVYLYLTRQ